MPDEPSLEDFDVIADALVPRSQFQPVHLDHPLPRTLRQTWLRHFNNCPRSAFLASKYEGMDNTPAMARGSAAHEVFKRATALAVSRNEPMVPPDVVKSLLDDVLAEYPVPLEEHDYVREMAYRWAAEVTFDPGMVVALESLFELQVGEWRVRARIDFAESLDEDRTLLIRDYKSSRAAPPYEEIARRSADGRLVAKNFQLVLYALLMHFGVPVREEPCPGCDNGTLRYAVDEGGEPIAPLSQMRGTVDWAMDFDCPECSGTGIKETPEPFPIAARAQRFDLEFVYPGLEDREGRMVRRPVTLERLELEEYRSSLEGLIARVERSEQPGAWPAVVSDAACGECPAPADCPIPYEVRDYRGVVNTPEQAADSAMVLDRMKATVRSMQTELRNWAKVNGSIRYGQKVMELVYSEHESMDHKGFLAAIAEGEIVPVEDYVKVKGRTDFKARDLTADELEGQDG